MNGLTFSHGHTPSSERPVVQGQECASKVFYVETTLCCKPAKRACMRFQRVVGPTCYCVCRVFTSACLSALLFMCRFLCIFVPASTTELLAKPLCPKCTFKIRLSPEYLL